MEGPSHTSSFFPLFSPRLPAPAIVSLQQLGSAWSIALLVLSLDSCSALLIKV